MPGPSVPTRSGGSRSPRKKRKAVETGSEGGNHSPSVKPNTQSARGVGPPSRRSSIGARRIKRGRVQELDATDEVTAAYDRDATVHSDAALTTQARRMTGDGNAPTGPLEQASATFIGGADASSTSLGNESSFQMYDAEHSFSTSAADASASTAESEFSGLFSGSRHWVAQPYNRSPTF